MEVIRLNEAGYEDSLLGLSLSFKEEGIPLDVWWTKEKFEQMERLAKKQGTMDGGHNKFLESIITWWWIRAPRGWWQEYDTYRLETKNSASTMHTIQRRALGLSDYEQPIPQWTIEHFNEVLHTATDGFENKGRLSGDNLKTVKHALPEGYLQTRQCRISYKTLRNMILQRRTHRYDLWQFFIKSVLEQVEHPELLPELEDGKK
jgi:hypothetical protein